jgi:hypothetical protein
MSLRSAKSVSPPRAALAFRVGIIGHRPDRLPKDEGKLETLRLMLRNILEEVKAEISDYAVLPEAEALYADKPSILRAVSSLAEGTDRIFAGEAVALGYELICPMPFSQEEFEKDFLPPKALEPDSLARFRALLQRAGKGAGVTKFELDGDRSTDTEAYTIAGRVVVNQADLLIAVWDGGKSGGRGGTVETLHDAVHYNVPVLWIDADAPHAWQLLQEPDDLRCLEGDDRCVPRGAHPADPAEARQLIANAVRGIAREEIALPTASADTEQAQGTPSQALRYFLESKPRVNLAFTWKLFRDAVGSFKLRLPQILVPDFEAQIRDDWPVRDDIHDVPAASAVRASTNERSPPSDLEEWINRRLRPHYAWSDKRGDLYADAYRSGYVLTYLISATAVFLALLPMASGWKDGRQTICDLAELAILLGVVALLYFGRKRHWHERWMEYRLLAELIRQLRFLVPLGGGRPLPRTPTHLGIYGDLTQTWMYWHVRAIARATARPGARITPEYVRDCLTYLGKVVGDSEEGQLKFHRDTETRSEHIAHRLHGASTFLFWLVIFGIAGRVLHVTVDYATHAQWLPFHLEMAEHKHLDRWLILVAATFPALAAALAGINNQGEFARLAKRSAAMAGSFERFSAQIADLRSGGRERHDGPKLSEVIPLAAKIADVMVNEVADWRVVFSDRPPVAA